MIKYTAVQIFTLIEGYTIHHDHINHTQLICGVLYKILPLVNASIISIDKSRLITKIGIVLKTCEMHPSEYSWPHIQ